MKFAVFSMNRIIRLLNRKYLTTICLINARNNLGIEILSQLIEQREERRKEEEKESKRLKQINEVIQNKQQQQEQQQAGEEEQQEEEGKEEEEDYKIRLLVSEIYDANQLKILLSFKEKYQKLIEIYEINPFLNDCYFDLLKNCKYV